MMLHFGEQSRSYVQFIQGSVDLDSDRCMNVWGCMKAHGHWFLLSFPWRCMNFHLEIKAFYSLMTGFPWNVLSTWTLVCLSPFLMKFLTIFIKTNLRHSLFRLGAWEKLDMFSHLLLYFHMYVASERLLWPAYATTSLSADGMCFQNADAVVN